MLNILIVDDSIIMRKVLIKSLRHIGYGENIREAENGREALEIVSKDSDINCIFLDIDMPIMNGLEFIEKLKEYDDIERFEIILTSAKVSALSKEQIDNLNLSGIIPKPFKKEDVESVLHPLLDMLSRKFEIKRVEFEKEILIVDDSISIRKIIKRQLLDIGCKNIFEASNGREALEVVSEHIDIKLIFVDITMPIMDGATLIKQLEKSEIIENIEVILISSKKDKLDELMKNSKALNGVLKPFKQDELIDIIIPTLEKLNQNTSSENYDNFLEEVKEEAIVLDDEEIEINFEEIEKVGEIQEIKADFNIEEAIDIYFQVDLKLIDENRKFFKNSKKLDFNLLKRFIYTAYNQLSSIEPAFKSDIVSKQKVELTKLENRYKNILDSKKLPNEIAYEEVFLAQQKSYNFIKDISKNLYKNIKKERDSAYKLYEKLKLKKEALEKFEDRESIQYKNFLKEFKSLNQEYAEMMYRISLAKKHTQNLDKLLKDFKSKYIEIFEPIYKTKVDSIELEFKSLLDIFCYKFDYNLWQRAKESKKVKAFFDNSKIIGSYSTQTFLEYYLKSIDKDRLSDENRKLLELLKYLQKNDSRNIVILNHSVDELMKMKSIIDRFNFNCKVQAFTNPLKLVDKTLPKQDLIIIEYDMKSLNLDSLLSEYKSIYKLKSSDFNILIMISKYDKDMIISLIERGVIDLAKRNYIVKPHNLNAKELETKIKLLI